jgi:hypothetical protein
MVPLGRIYGGSYRATDNVLSPRKYIPPPPPIRTSAKRDLDTVFGIASRLWAGWVGVRIRSGQEIFKFLKRLNRLWGPPTLSLNPCEDECSYFCVPPMCATMTRSDNSMEQPTCSEIKQPSDRQQIHLICEIRNFINTFK